MNSFTRKLIINYTGVIFISFLVVYFLFNVMASNYIRSVAERELHGDMADVFISFGVSSGISNIAIEEGTFVTTFNIRPRTSIVDSNMIIIDDHQQIISPNFDFLSEAQQAEIVFITDYYRQNPNRFNNDGMQRLRVSDATFYVSTQRHFDADGEMTILMYSDISSAMTFTNRMNQILGILLVVSGLFGLAITLSLSSSFNQSITRLCNYAETIGRGNFQEQAGTFKDLEFAQLSKSMDNMSDMLQAYEAKQKQFFQNASHELRTPLMSIQGFAEGILDDTFDKNEGAEIILTEGHKMASLVDELLYASRMDSNIAAQEDELHPLSLPSLLNDCCERVKPLALAANKIMTLNASDEITINANYEKLERAITNILTNAIRHAASEITVSYHAEATTAYIRIQDDGDGIKPGDLPRIFERFYKGENGSYGLGLAISKDIIKSMGGRITAENNNGAVFYISLHL